MCIGGFGGGGVARFMQYRCSDSGVSHGIGTRHCCNWLQVLEPVVWGPEPVALEQALEQVLVQGQGLELSWTTPRPGPRLWRPVHSSS